MKIINEQFKKDLAAGKLLKVDLGCGLKPREGFYSVDHLELDGVDVVADLNKPLDLIPDSSVEYVYSHHVLEHIDEFLLLMREIHRIVTPNGKVEIIVPHFSNVFGYSDPTHVRFFGFYSMYYFVAPENQPKIRQVPAFYSDTRFIVHSVNIEFYKTGYIDKIFSPIFSKLVNRSIKWQNFYERRLSSLFHAWQIRFIMKPAK